MEGLWNKEQVLSWFFVETQYFASPAVQIEFAKRVEMFALYSLRRKILRLYISNKINSAP